MDVVLLVDLGKIQDWMAVLGSVHCKDVGSDPGWPGANKDAGVTEVRHGR